MVSEFTGFLNPILSIVSKVATLPKSIGKLDHNNHVPQPQIDAHLEHCVQVQKTSFYYMI